MLASSLGARDERTVPAGKGNYTVANPSEIAVFSPPYLATYGAARLNCLIASGEGDGGGQDAPMKGKACFTDAGKCVVCSRP